MELEERFWSKADWDIHDAERCWEWQGAKWVRGYGLFSIGRKNCYAHRLAYELEVGDVPEGMELDHLCRNKLCVNPWHLEAVSHRVNVQRAVGNSETHCRAGHEYANGNTYIQPDGKRRCRRCKADRSWESWARKQ